MTNEQRRSLGAYIRIIGDKMWCQNWVFTLADRPADEDKSASIEVQADIMHATILVDIAFDKNPPEEQRSTIVHEWCHVLLSGMRDVTNDLDHLLGKPAGTVVSAAHHHAEEVACHTLAHIIAPSMPLWEIPGEVRPE